MPRSTISRTAGCDTRRLTMDAGVMRFHDAAREEAGHGQLGQRQFRGMQIDAEVLQHEIGRVQLER